MGNKTSKTVDKIFVYGDYLTSSQLLDNIVSSKTKYLVFDLDKTFHLGRNMGEMLGWELVAYATYGQKYLEINKSRTDKKRFHFLKNHPIQSLSYLIRGARLWAYPGLSYLFGVRMGMSKSFSRKIVYGLFGEEPVSIIQELPRTALMHHLTELPLKLSLEMMHFLWKRYSDDQVFFKSNIEELKKKYPKLKIIISSASPKPVLEKAKAFLGVDDIIYSSTDEHEGQATSPYNLNRLFGLYKLPTRITSLDNMNHNSSHNKMTNLLKKYPDFCDQNVETVGVTDTSYGEDHSWSGFFTKLADVNSPAPFSPIVDGDSPLKEIHSARVLTRSEKKKLDANQKDFLDPRRKTFISKSLEFKKDFLENGLKRQIEITEKFQELYELALKTMTFQNEEIEQKLGQLHQEMDSLVKEYNQSIGKARKLTLKKLRKQLKKQRTLRRKLIKLEKPLAKLKMEIKNSLEVAREFIGSPEFLSSKA